MKITVIGHLCLDTIRHGDGRVTESYGGIYYSLAALAHLLPEGDTIAPVFGVGRDEHEKFMEQVARFPNVDTSGIYRMQGPTNSVTLSYGPGGRRVEVSKNIPEPIPWKKIQPACDCDLVLVNMISGFDVTLETLDEIRMKMREKDVPVFFDVHSLTLGLRHNDERFHRPVDVWRRWLFMLHTVQMNEDESSVISPERYDEDNLVKQGLALHTRAICLTRGAGGCSLFVNDKKRIRRRDFAAATAGEAVDTTGCGDVFGAAYCAHLVHSGDITGAVGYANDVASFKAGILGSAELGTISKLRINTGELTGEKK